MRISDWSSDVCSSDLVLERDQPLIMIHGQHRIEITIHALSEKTVCRIWAISQDIFRESLVDSRFDDGAVFGTKKSVVTCMRIQSQNGDAGLWNPKIFFQASVHHPQLGQDHFFAQGVGDIL